MAFNIDALLNKHNDGEEEVESSIESERDTSEQQVMTTSLPGLLMQQSLIMRASLLTDAATNEQATPSLSELQMLLEIGGRCALITKMTFCVLSLNNQIVAVVQRINTYKELGYENIMHSRG
jgi:hypothetical protein